MKITLKEKVIYIDDKATLLMCGEIHYFRLNPEEWENRILQLKNSGFNTIASYIPWSIHQQSEDVIDLIGETKEQYNLKLFLKLIQKHDLFFIARPGPFVMAEMVGEGVPTWLKEKHPEIIPDTWDGQVTPNQTVDYLAPNFLLHTKKWYKHVFEIIKGVDKLKLVGIQLDNEIGMLSWVSNSPDLTLNVAKGMLKFAFDNKFDELLSFELTNEEDFLKVLQKPMADDEVVIHNLIGEYSRYRFNEYIEILKGYVEENNISEIPYLINIHGTGGEKLFGYPIGISQLYKTYMNKKNFIAGSDLYFGNIDLSNFHELYLANAMTESTLDEDQVLSALEFNATSGDYSNSIANRKSKSSLEIQSKMMLSQNNKLVNYYLFSGGYNDFLNEEANDGRNRIASTGELHGYGAPIDPYGKKAYFYDAIENVGNISNILNEKLAKVMQRKDSIALAFIPDYYMSEYCYSKSNAAREIYDNIIRNRAEKINDTLFKYTLIRGYQPSVINIQDNMIDDNVQMLMVPSAKYMGKDIQEKIVSYLKKGNKIFLVGEIPEFDMLGNKCSILKDYLKLDITEFEKKKYMSIVPSGYLKGNVTSFIWDAQAISSELNNEEIFKLYDPKVAIGLHIKDEFEAIVLTCAYRVDFQSFDKIFDKLELKPSLSMQTNDIGTYAFVLEDEKEKFLNIINFDENIRKVKYELDNKPLFDGKEIYVGSRESKIVPIDVTVGNFEIKYSTEEIKEIKENKIIFRLNSNESIIKVVVNSNNSLKCSIEDASVIREDECYLIEIKNRKVTDTELTLTLE